MSRMSLTATARETRLRSSTATKSDEHGRVRRQSWPARAREHTAHRYPSSFLGVWPWALSLARGRGSNPLSIWGLFCTQAILSAAGLSARLLLLQHRPDRSHRSGVGAFTTGRGDDLDREHRYHVRASFRMRCARRARESGRRRRACTSGRSQTCTRDPRKARGRRATR
jgi:hypothetical protein